MEIFESQIRHKKSAHERKHHTHTDEKREREKEPLSKEALFLSLSLSPSLSLSFSLSLCACVRVRYIKREMSPSTTTTNNAERRENDEEEETNLPKHLTALAKECLLSLNPLHAILCLEATFQNDRAKFPAGSIEEARNRLMIGKILNAVTENQAEAKRHLEMGAFI